MTTKIFKQIRNVCTIRNNGYRAGYGTGGRPSASHRVNLPRQERHKGSCSESKTRGRFSGALKIERRAVS